jgi:hypothetical protein
MQKKILILVLFFLYTTNAFSEKKFIATVAKIRGNVTKLVPGAHEASIVNLDDQLLEDTSLVTGPNSFIKLKFIDQSELVMGPESKIVVSEMKENSPGVISLLKGRIRTEVQKSAKLEEQNQNKFYIRTRTAAMGVRGTDFQTIYNPENKMTSLLTFKGAVAMAKIDEKNHQKLENSKIVRNESTNQVTIEKKEFTHSDEKEVISKILKGNDVVIVPPGQNSFASSALKKTSLPVKISPIQLNALYKNNELSVNSANNIKEVNRDEQQVEGIATSDQKAPKEGFFNQKTGDFAPKSGGFIDLNTGLYVAPDSSAVLDQKNGVYVSSKVGSIDRETGQYVAPKGLTLDAKNGFVVNKGDEKKPELLALKEDMNKSIARDVVVGDLDGEVVLAIKNLNEKYIRNNVSLSFSRFNEDMYLNESVNGRQYFGIDTRDSMGISFDYRAASAYRIAPLFGLKYSRISNNDILARGFTQDSKSVFKLSAGFIYAVTDRFESSFKIILDQSHYAQIATLNPDTYTFKRMTLTKFNLNLNYEFLRSQQYSLFANVSGEIGARKKLNNNVVRDIAGMNFMLTPQIKLTEKILARFSGFYRFEDSVITNNISSTNQSREVLGLEIGFNFLY